MIYGIIVPAEVSDKQAAERKIREVVAGLEEEPSAIVTNGGEGLPSYTATFAHKRWPDAIHQVIAPAEPRPGRTFDFKLKRIARIQFAPKGSAYQSLRNAEDLLIGVVDKLIVLVETPRNSDSVLADQLERARDRNVPFKTEKLPR